MSSLILNGYEFILIFLAKQAMIRRWNPGFFSLILDSFIRFLQIGFVSLISKKIYGRRTEKK